jgi:hypothetical protein
MGEMRSMVFVILGGMGLFSLLQNMLWQKSEQGTKMQLSIPDVLADFRWVGMDLIRCPKRILEVSPRLLTHALGAQDSAHAGTGGVHFTPLLDGIIDPIMWRFPFALSTQSKLVSFANPKGAIINNNP